MYDKNNVFAKMIRGEIPTRKVYENEYAMSFYDINPMFSTHVLEVAEKLSNRVSIINGGEIFTSGDMDEVVKEGKTLEDIFMEVAADA